MSDAPEGPYELAETVLPPRGDGFWDGKMTHNPTIHRCPVTGRFLLFYSGNTYRGPRPTAGGVSEQRMWEAQGNQRIGLAVADTPEGPWTRFDHPVLEPRPGKWDARITNNPAPCVGDDGSVLLAYKSQPEAKAPTSYGIARAPRFDQPFVRLRDEPVFEFDDPQTSVEDACLWHEAGRFHMIFKDRTAKLTGEHHAGVYARSDDAIHWQLGDPPKAWSRRVRWDDGQVSVLGSLERVVPGHPISGTERAGVGAAFSALYRDRRVVLTPVEETLAEAIDAVTRLWELTGAYVEQLPVDVHDRFLAATSHLPHMLAFGLVDSIATRHDADRVFRYVAGGFRDFTRIASSDPIMWRDICIANRDALLRALQEYQDDLDALTDEVERGDGDALLERFTRAKAARDHFCG